MFGGHQHGGCVRDASGQWDGMLIIADHLLGDRCQGGQLGEESHRDQGSRIGKGWKVEPM
jgi:hypothetical protein